MDETERDDARAVALRVGSPWKRWRRERRRAKKFERALRDLDADAQGVIRQVAPYTLLNPEKLYAWIEAVRYVHRHRIEGALVECGVWRGGAVMAGALTLRQLGASDREFWLYDTFAGMTRPGAEDVARSGSGDPEALFERSRTGEDSSEWCYASLEDVRANLARVDYPAERFVLVPGKVEDTLPGRRPERIAILRLDTDWYESTRHEMEHLMPLLVPRGVLIVDDYHRWAGNAKAVDEWLEAQGVPVLLTKVGRSAIGVRP